MHSKVTKCQNQGSLCSHYLAFCEYTVYYVMIACSFFHTALFSLQELSTKGTHSPREYLRRSWGSVQGQSDTTHHPALLNRPVHLDAGEARMWHLLPSSIRMQKPSPHHMRGRQGTLLQEGWKPLVYKMNSAHLKQQFNILLFTEHMASFFLYYILVKAYS